MGTPQNGPKRHKEKRRRFKKEQALLLKKLESKANEATEAKKA